MDSIPPSTPPSSSSPSSSSLPPGEPQSGSSDDGRDNSLRKRIRPTQSETALSAVKKNRPGGRVAHDAVFSIDDDWDRQRVLAHYRRQSPQTPVVMLSSPRALDEQDLTQTVTCAEYGLLNVSSGRLFSGEPITLVLDLTTMTPGQIASLNDLLDTPPSLKGKPLGSEVRRIVLTNTDMLQSGYGKPGPDCWRRLQKLAALKTAGSLDGSAFQAAIREPVLSNRALLEQQVKPYEASEMQQLTLQPSTITLDFATADHWRTALFGGLTLDDQGKPCFRPSQLASLPENVSVILQDAPWGDTSFEQALATVLRERHFYANGQQVAIPEDIPLYRKDTTKEALTTLKQPFFTGRSHQQKSSQRKSSQITAPFVCLNGDSLEKALSGIQIREGIICSVDTLSELLQDCQQIRITGPLTDQQWLQLLRRAERLNPKPGIVVDEGKGWQPPDTIRSRVVFHESSALEAFKGHKVYRFTAGDSWESLWYDTAMISQNDFRFEQRETELLTALKSGEPLVLHGMDGNPALAAHLESLLACPPYLFVNGQKILLPKANVTFLWPAPSAQAPQKAVTGLWQQALQQASCLPPPVSQQELLIALLKALPPSTCKAYPGAVPWEALDFQAVLNRQIELEKQQDGASERHPVHHRKALHTLLVKSYRGDDEVYGYLKTWIRRLHPDTPPETKADRRALQQWLQNHPEPDRDLLKKHFWSLARHCPVWDFGHQLPDAYEAPAPEAIDVLALYLVGCTAKDRQSELARQLNINLSDRHTCRYYDAPVRSRLRDALLIAGGQRKGSKCISEQVKDLEITITDIIARHSQVQAIPLVKKALKSLLPDALLEEDFKDLPAALVAGEPGSRRRQLRRVKRLAARVSQHPLVFLQGVAGAGKSHMAQGVADELRHIKGQETMPKPMVLSLGPETTRESLYGRQVLQELVDGDQNTVFVPGPLLQWALNDNPPVLILDEANMAPEGVLTPLAGLTHTPPQLCFQGEIYPLSDRHRVILTGNPDFYDGRRMDSAIQQRMLTLYYRPLSPDTLAELVIQPALPRGWSPTLKAHTTRAVLSLYTQYGNLLPDDLSPRDLQDVLARMNQTLRHAGRDSITNEQASTLVWQGFTDSLAGAVSRAQLPAVTALEHWYRGHFPPEAAEENAISASRQLAFETFLHTLRRNNPDIDLDTKPVIKLVHHYWLFLDKQQDASRGRRGIIVEGPAGWGKDLILDRVLDLWAKQHPALPIQGGSSSAPPVHINANASQWDSQVHFIKAAMEQGQKLVISELNLLPGHYLEGLFNEVLTGYAHPGFVLFATINPASFGGREPLSTALKNRCTQVRLSPLGRDDLNGILQRRYPGQHTMNEWLSQRFHVMSDQLNKRHAPIQLTLDDLFRGADALQGKMENDWPETFQSIYGLALQSLQWSPEALEKALEPLSEPMDDGRIQRQQALSLWINQERDAPVRVQLLPPGKRPVFKAPERALFLPDHPDLEVLKDWAHYVLAGGQPIRAGSVVSGAFGGNIIQPAHYNIKKFFAGNEYNTDRYRLEVKKLAMRDGQLQEVKVPCDEGGAEPLSHPGWQERHRTLEAGEQLGSGQFRLSKNQWLPLPGLSARDRLIHLRCRKDLPLTLARGRDTGQLLVKLAENATCDTADTTLDFIIMPDRHGLKKLIPGEMIQVCEGLCDPVIRQWLDDQVFSPKVAIHDAYYELQVIKAEPDPCQQLLALAKWCQEFGDSRDVPGQGLGLLTNLIREKQGVCRHRSQVFQVLSEYLGIPARMISNTAHQYVEISPDGGRQWRRLDLGGGEQYTWTEQSSDWPSGISPSPFKKPAASRARPDLSDLYEQCMQGVDTAGAWQQLQDCMTSDFLEYHSHSYDIFGRNRIEHLLEQGFELDQALPEMFLSWQQQLEKVRSDPFIDLFYDRVKEQALSFLLKIHDLWEAGKLSGPRYISVTSRCLGLIKQGIPPVGTILPLLEQLAQNPEWRTEAETVLEDFYRQLTQPRQWIMPDNTKPDDTTEDLQGQSETLLTALHQSRPETKWRWVSDSHPPHVQRMAQKKAPFPVTDMGYKTRSVFVNFPLERSKTDQNLDDIFETFVHEPSKQDKIPGLKRLAGMIESDQSRIHCAYYTKRSNVKGSFLRWLFKQDRQQTWHWLAREQANIKSGRSNTAIAWLLSISPQNDIDRITNGTHFQCVHRFKKSRPESREGKKSVW